MKKLLVFTLIGSFAWTSGCGQDDDIEAMLDDAAAVAALSEGDGESLDGVPEGDAEGEAEEQADDASGEEATLSDECSR